MFPEYAIKNWTKMVKMIQELPVYFPEKKLHKVLEKMEIKDLDVEFFPAGYGDVGVNLFDLYWTLINMDTVHIFESKMSVGYATVLPDYLAQDLFFCEGSVDERVNNFLKIINERTET